MFVQIHRLVNAPINQRERMSANDSLILSTVYGYYEQTWVQGETDDLFVSSVSYFTLILAITGAVQYTKSCTVPTYYTVRPTYVLSRLLYYPEICTVPTFVPSRRV